MRLLLARFRRREEGFSLVELLVGVTVFGLISTTVAAAVLTSSKVADNNVVFNDLNGEARNVLNRVSRELREAKRITAVTNPGGTGYVPESDVALTLEVDFDGDGTIEASAADPEVLTYRYQRSTRQLLLTAAGYTVPVLAGNVEDFKLTYYARVGTADRLALDGLGGASGGLCGSMPTTPVKDNQLEWMELDADPLKKYGDCNGVLSAAELPYISSVGIELEVLKEPREQVYRTRVDLRNNRA
jgi:prepilin-type N-terminal cleavage/methylation domain-containing protein